MFDLGNSRVQPSDISYVVCKKTTLYKVPGALWIKGVAVDKNDEVWFGNFLHGTLGKLDPMTGQVEQHKTPTRYSSLYAPVADRKGNLWMSDFSGSQVTRLKIGPRIASSEGL